jgi:lipopolysaccharide transport system ATP-binding protein
MTHPRNWLRQMRESTRSAQEFWALRDINLEIRPGEVVGIIGRNGAGKSTLLKILSRITEPTGGRIRLRGRIASLLEVATGFHPDLSGRENVFLNGAILGMSRAEITRKFDEIVAFAGVEQFLDTPVKRYSSGMYVRLAFAVAAHLEPDILVVDEVLAVGDAEFQKKCLDKMDDVGHTGRTVLFVSHNMQAVTRLSNRCVLLEDGRVRHEGLPHRVASAYLNSGVGTTAQREWLDPATAPGSEVGRLRAVRVRSERGELVDHVDIRRPVGIELEFEVLEPGHIFHPHFGVHNEDGLLLFMAQDVDPVWRRRPRPVGRYRSTGWIPGNLLAEGAFSVRAALITLEPEEQHAFVEDAVSFRVVDCLTAADTARGDYALPVPGVLRPLLRWTTQELYSEESPIALAR